MSPGLSSTQCEACRKDSKPVSQSERENFLKQVPGWEIIFKNESPRLEKRFDFNTYEAAVAFTLKVTLIAQQADHHPFLITAPNYVKVRWWTHIINNLHKNDFIMAARTNELYNEQQL